MAKIEQTAAEDCHAEHEPRGKILLFMHVVLTLTD